MSEGHCEGASFILGARGPPRLVCKSLLADWPERGNSFVIHWIQRGLSSREREMAVNRNFGHEIAIMNIIYLFFHIFFFFFYVPHQDILQSHRSGHSIFTFPINNQFRNIGHKHESSCKERERERERKKEGRKERKKNNRKKRSTLIYYYFLVI